MAYYSAGVLHQRMHPFARVIVPIDQAVIGIEANIGSIVEGGTINMTISRTGLVNSIVTYSWEFTSEGGSADFSTTPTGTRTLTNGVVSDTVSVTTVQRTGIQGIRRCTCRITSVVDGIIDPVNPQASTDISDFAAPPVGTGYGWHKQLSYRSGRPWASGPCQWGALSEYEAVAYVDAFAGDNYGNSFGRISTWALMAGGPKNNPDSIDVNGALNWSSTNIQQFPRNFNDMAANQAWMVWTMSIIPYEARTDTGTIAARTAVWDLINTGSQDQFYLDMGARIARNCANRGVSMEWLVLRHCHENDQSNPWRVYPTAKNQYKSAAARAFDLIRQGADFNIRVAFSPGPNKNYDGFGDMGTLDSWCPANVDIISPSFHPNAAKTTRTRYLTMFSGTTSEYGVEADFLDLAIRKGYKMAFAEWSPTFLNPIADDVYGWFYNEFLTVYRDLIVFDCVFDSDTLNPNAYTGTNPDGAEAWANGVTVFRDLWRGKRPNDTTFNRPSWPVSAPIPSFAVVRPPVILGPSRAAPPSGFITAPTFNATTQNDPSSPIATTRDYRGKVAIQHNVGQGAVTSFNLTVTGAAGAILGGQVRTTNVAFSSLSWREVLAAEWGVAPALNWAAASGDGFAEAWDIQDAVNAITTVASIPLSNRLYNRSMYLFHVRNACVNNDAQRTMTFENVYFNGYAIITQITTAAQSGAITVIKNSILHLDRQPYDTIDGTTAPAAGSKRVGPYTGPGSANEGVVSGTADGFAHGWFFRTTATTGGLYKMRLDISDCVLRIDTVPVTGAAVSFFPPAGDGVGANSNTGSRYRRVTVLWFGGGTWDAAGFGQTKAQLATLGITVEDDEATAWAIWQTLRTDFFVRNGYDSATATFEWGVTAGDSPPDEVDPDVPEADDPTTTVPTSWPYSPNTFYNRLSFTGLNRHYQGADQHCISERADGALIDIGADEAGWLGGETREEFRLVAITGTPPLARNVTTNPNGLTGANLAFFPDEGPGADYQGRAKPQGILCLPNNNIVAFYSHTGGSPDADGGGKAYVGLSTDNGATVDWNDDSGGHIFDVAADGLMICGVLQTFAGYSSMPDNRFLSNDYVYVFVNNRRQQRTDTYNITPGGSPIYMARCKYKGSSNVLTDLKVRANWEMFAGLDVDGKPTWSATKSNKKAVFMDSNGIGLFFQVGWHTQLNRFVACYVHCSPRSPLNTAIPSQAIAIATNKYPWKQTGWRMLAYGRLAPTANDETNMYMSCFAPNRWDDGTNMYLALSTYVIPGGGSGDNLIVTKATLVAAGGGDAPANTDPPVITGTATVDSTLTSSQGSWTNSPTSYAYLWTADNASISGATSNTFVVTTAEVSKAIRCRVTASNGSGSTAVSTAPVNIPGVATPIRLVPSTNKIFLHNNPSLSGPTSSLAAISNKIYISTYYNTSRLCILRRSNGTLVTDVCDHSATGIDDHARYFVEFLQDQHTSGRPYLMWWDREDDGGATHLNIPSGITRSDNSNLATYARTETQSCRDEAVRWQAAVAAKCYERAAAAGLTGFEMAHDGIPPKSPYPGELNYATVATDTKTKLLDKYFSYASVPCYFSWQDEYLSKQEYIDASVNMIEGIRTAYGPTVKILPTVWPRFFNQKGYGPGSNTEKDNNFSNSPTGTYMIPAGWFEDFLNAILDAGADGWSAWRSSEDDDLYPSTFSARWQEAVDVVNSRTDFVRPT